MDSNAYLWQKTSSRIRSKRIFWLISFFIKISSQPLIGAINKFVSNIVNYHLFTFINGASFSKKFAQCGLLPRIGRNCTIYYPKKNTMGDFVSIGNCVTVYNEAAGGEIKIGDNTHIADFSYLSGLGGLKIGNNVAVSSGVKIYSHSNDYKNKTKLFREQVKKGEIIIGNNVLIGANVVILPGIKIGNNSVIGAGAVVTKNISNNSLAVGIPAKFRQKI